jgi:hypothetical protein
LRDFDGYPVKQEPEGLATLGFLPPSPHQFVLRSSLSPEFEAHHATSRSFTSDILSIVSLSGKCHLSVSVIDWPIMPATNGSNSIVFWSVHFPLWSCATSPTLSANRIYGTIRFHRLSPHTLHSRIDRCKKLFPGCGVKSCSVKETVRKTFCGSDSVVSVGCC